MRKTPLCDFCTVILAPLDFFVQQADGFRSFLANNELILIHIWEVALKNGNELVMVL